MTIAPRQVNIKQGSSQWPLIIQVALISYNLAILLEIIDCQYFTVLLPKLKEPPLEAFAFQMVPRKINMPSPLSLSLSFPG